MLYLINPNERRILDNAGDRIPLGLCSISEYMKNRGYKVKIWDMNHESDLDLMRQFHKDKPDAVGVSCYTSAIYPEAVAYGKAFRGKTKTIVGGYHASAMPLSLTDHFDSVVCGEGEQGFNIALSHNGLIHAPPVSLDKLTLKTDLDLSRYGIAGQQGTILTSRGCPYNCAFCFNLSRKVRNYDMGEVKKQLNTLKGKFKSVYFLDDVFTLDRERMKEITDFCREIDLPFRCTTRANLIDKDKINILANNGCECLSMGIESGDDEILARSNKKMNVYDNINAVEMAHNWGIPVKGFFIIGLPGESEVTARRTIRLAQDLSKWGLKQADFYYLTPFPGTPIWNNPDKYGIKIKDKDYTKYLEAGKTARCVIDTEHLTSKRIEDLVKEARATWKN
jgi:radical SAM superfamily enzyme YgiQ (UPF0313 family)